MPAPPSDFLPLINTVGVTIAAIGLIFTARNSYLTRRDTDVSTIFEVWRQYERYAHELGQSESEEQGRALTLNLLNYIENLCHILNHRLAGEGVLRNIRGLVADFLAAASFQIDFENVLRAYEIDPNSFSEIRTFRRKNKALLLQKARSASNSIYVSLGRRPPSAK